MTCVMVTSIINLFQDFMRIFYVVLPSAVEEGGLGERGPQPTTLVMTVRDFIPVSGWRDSYFLNFDVENIRGLCPVYHMVIWSRLRFALF